MAIDIGKIIIRLVGDASSYVNMLNQAQSATAAATANIRSLGIALSAGISAPLIAMGVGAVKAFGAFDKSMTESMAIMDGLTDDQMKRMREEAMRMSQEVAQSPEALAKSFHYLASAGFSAEQSIALLPAVARFATAG